MAEVINETQQEFWRSPTLVEPTVETTAASAMQARPEACSECGSEFMIGARFCHSCGFRRAEDFSASGDASTLGDLWTRSVVWIRAGANSISVYWGDVKFPGWLRYFHFHEIQGAIGLPTA